MTSKPAAQWLTPAPVIARFDLYAALSAAQLAVAANGGNAVDACFASDVYRESSAAQRVFHPDCAPVTVDGAPRFAQFAFFDGIHPTGAAHAVIGEAPALARRDGRCVRTRSCHDAPAHRAPA